MMPRTFLGALTALVFATYAVPASAAEGPAVAARDWTFDGIFGTFDRAALKRGFQVYSEVCASCHSMSLLFYRNLGAIGFTEEEIKKIAAAIEVIDGPNDEGEMFERPGRATDRFKAPFPNTKAARAGNNGALPPDLSLTIKAMPGGADYIHALLTGYRDPPPKGVELPDGMSYNAAFAGGQIAMPPPLSEDGVEFADRTKASVDQMAADITTFLAWAAEPELEDRKRMGIKVILFLIVLTGMLYAVKRKTWANLH